MIILQVNAQLETLESKDLVQSKGLFGLYNCLMLGHTKYNGVAGLLQPVPCEITLLIGPRYDSASRY